MLRSPRLPGLLALLFVVAPSCSEPPPRAEDRAPLAPVAPATAPAPDEERPARPGPQPAPTSPEAEEAAPTTLEEQREKLFATMHRELGLADEQVEVIRAIFEASPYLGQGNPALSQHPMTRGECRKIRAEAALADEDSPRCGAPHMAPLYDPTAGQGAGDAGVCIDRFEFPGIPCEYPVTYARANEAAALCRAVGKRLCDAHEWEGACAGALRPFESEYAFERDRLQATHHHNSTRERVWAYGATRDAALCATFGGRSPGCTGEWSKCGSHTYPAGSFPGCRSPLGVYDLHGNAAEHMNLPLAPDERAARGDEGSTEMKGSWFGFAGKLPHEDDCRWRAPDWHATRIRNPSSHRNYHLGFRCCRDVAETAEKVPDDAR